MSRLACLGGKAVTDNLLDRSDLSARPDLEREYLLQAYDSGVWDDWPGKESMAARFEREWAAFNNSRFCALLTNGTHALQVALETLDIGAGDEVIVPGLTWQATASAVCDVNAVPVPVDVDETTLCIDTERIEKAITSRTRAIIPVHLYGQMCDMRILKSVADKHNLRIIEDAAHCIEGEIDGIKPGELSDVACFSFYFFY